MTLQRESPCKVNFLLNILGKRPDGFHELESVMVPVPICDRLEFARGRAGIQLDCDHPALPTDGTNLVWRAASAFLAAARIAEGVRIRLEKKIPLSAGLGGGSSNAAHTLLALNDLFGRPLAPAPLTDLATKLGSDVPFFLQTEPALALGRGERIEPLGPFARLRGMALVLVHPGFGVSTAWAYQQLGRFPTALNGQPGRARRLVDLLAAPEVRRAAAEFYNSLETPVLEKFPWLRLVQEHLRANGAIATLMSGSGSTTFALVKDQPAAQRLVEGFRKQFGETPWVAEAAL